MQPHPDVSQYQGDAHEQQSQSRIARAGLDPRLVHLSIAGFDAKAFSVEFPNFPPRVVNFADREQQLLATFLARFLVQVVVPEKAP